MADESSKTKQKRRLRAPAETVREKAVRTQDQASQPSRKRRVRGHLAWPLRALAWIGHRPPLKQIGHALRWFFSLRFMRFLGLILGLRYLIASFSELKLVTWPSRTQSRRLTTAVIIFSVVFGGLIAGVDFGLNKLFKELLLK
jgi:preprotein translocase SecE subunit